MDIESYTIRTAPTSFFAVLTEPRYLKLCYVPVATNGGQQLYLPVSPPKVPGYSVSEFVELGCVRFELNDGIIGAEAAILKLPEAVFDAIPHSLFHPMEFVLGLRKTFTSGFENCSVDNCPIISFVNEDPNKRFPMPKYIMQHLGRYVLSPALARFSSTDFTDSFTPMTRMSLEDLMLAHEEGRTTVNIAKLSKYQLTYLREHFKL